MTTTELSTPSDTTTWLPLEDLAPGFDANKAPLSSDLAGREVTVVDERGTRVTHRFGESTVSWDYHPGAGDPVAESSGEDACEVVRVDDGLYYAQFHHSAQPNEAVTLILDVTNGRALTVVQTIRERTKVNTAVGQTFTPGLIEGMTAGGVAPAPS
ncbi:MAG: MoaF N-terminal domain-containing protein, partial [Aquihabitans sp.]